MIEDLEIKPSIVINLVLAYSTILSSFFLSFSINDLQFLIPVVIEQTSIPTTEFAVPTGTPTTEANAKIEAQLLTAEIKYKNFQSNLKPTQFL